MGFTINLNVGVVQKVIQYQSGSDRVQEKKKDKKPETVVEDNGEEEKKKKKKKKKKKEKKDKNAPEYSLCPYGCPYPKGYPNLRPNGYGSDYLAAAEQMFSDENPNACSVM